MLQGIKFATFLSTPEEWHALVIGLCEVICPWPPRLKIMDQDQLSVLKSEPHYYHFGRSLGVLFWLGLLFLFFLFVPW